MVFSSGPGKSEAYRERVAFVLVDFFCKSHLFLSINTKCEQWLALSARWSCRKGWDLPQLSRQKMPSPGMLANFTSNQTAPIKISSM
jgi:hypothetical protein